MATRKGWAELTPAYRKRLSNAGISESVYTSGAGYLNRARGHAYKPPIGPAAPKAQRLWANRAKARDIGEFIPGFDSLKVTEQNRIGEAYVKGHWQKWRGPRVRRRNGRGELKVFKSQSNEQINAAMDFNQAYEEANNGEQMGGQFWKDFRDTYMTSLTAA